MKRQTHCQVCLSDNGEEKNVATGCMLRVNLENSLNFQLLVTVSSLAICSPCCNLIEMWSVFAARARTNLAALSQNSAELAGNAGRTRPKSQTQDLSRLLKQVLQSTDGPQTCYSTTTKGSRGNGRNNEYSIRALVHPNIRACSVVLNQSEVVKYLEQHSRVSASSQHGTSQDLLQENAAACHAALEKTAIREWDTQENYCPLEMKIEIESDPPSPDNSSFGNCSAPSSPVAASLVSSSDSEESDDTSQGYFDKKVSSSSLDTTSGQAKVSESHKLQDGGIPSRRETRKCNAEERQDQKCSKGKMQNRFHLRSASKSVDDFAMCDSSNVSDLNFQTSSGDPKNNTCSSSQTKDVEKADHENNYACIVCETKFCHSYSLNRHYNSVLHKNNVKAATVMGKLNKELHTSLSNFHCEMCNAGFSQKSTLKTHIQRHLKQNGITLKRCDFCSKQFFTRKGLTEHIFTHLSAGKYFCYSCKMIFSTEVDLEQHVTSLRCKNLNTWNCNYCAKKLYSSRSYGKHVTNIHNVNLIERLVPKKSEKIKEAPKCNICDRVFSQTSHLRRHLLLAHKLIEPKKVVPRKKGAFKCNICYQTFSQNWSLSRHRLRLHKMNPEKVLGNRSKKKRSASASHICQNKIQCKICMTPFAEKYNLNRHMSTVCRKNLLGKVEDSQKPKLTCNECELSCRNMYRLRMHMLKAHNVDVPKFSCNKCDSSFLHRRNLERHLKVSHATGDFMCEICGASFSDFNKLENHIKHHQSTHFACQVCNESFENQSNLKDHLFWVHIFPTLPYTAWEFWKPEVFLLECDFCSETFTSELQLEKHTLEHLKKSKNSTKNGNETVDNSIDAEMCELLNTDGPFRKFFPCFACSEEFSPIIALKQHILMVHNDAQQMQCKLCDSLTSNTDRYITHLQRCHRLNPGLKLQCPYCSNVLKTPVKFVAHFGGSLPLGLNLANCCISSSEMKKKDHKTYSCEFCENVYKSYMGHRKHVTDYHPDEWKHKCKFCGKKFLWFCKARKHERIFHKEKIVCPYCKKTVTKPGELKQHVQQVHDGKPAFFCEKCDLEFPSRVSLQFHTSKHDSFEFTVHKAQISNESAVTDQKLLDHPTSSQENETVDSIICPNCNLHFPSLNQMKIHMYTVHKKMHCYSCIECGTVFSLLPKLEEHMQIYHTHEPNQSQSKNRSKIGVKPVRANNKIYECKKCGEQTLFYSGYLAHVATCRPDVLCQGCGKSRRYFRNQKIMSMHEEHCKTVSHPHKCAKCPLKFVSAHFLRRHKWRHDLCWADKMSCAHCPLSYSSIAKVLEHYTRNHMNQLPFPLYCKHCDFNCDNLVELKLHATQHNQQMVHCTQCHRDVTVARFKRCHILTCKSASICSICSMECGTTAGLFLHVQQDHETGNHSCLLCLNSFPSESNLQQHVAHNHGQTSFQCDICKVNLSYKENLRSHIKLHIHGKNRCRICGREFTQLFHILQHTLNEHKNVIPPYFLEALYHL